MEAGRVLEPMALLQGKASPFQLQHFSLVGDRGEGTGGEEQGMILPGQEVALKHLVLASDTTAFSDDF